MKGGRLPSLMRPILNRTSAFFVILFSLLFIAGCSSGPRVEANQAIEQANEKISAHDRLFDEARNAYSQAQRSIRDGGGSTTPESTETTSESTGPQGGESESISEARSKLEDARTRLKEARDEIASIQELEVSEELLDYSRTLEEALNAQIRGEKREIAFYGILAEDPALEENRERAIERLDEAKKAYAKAESGYEEAGKIADSNPNVVAPESG